MQLTNQIIILLLSITACYGFWIWYNSCFKQLDKLHKMFGSGQIEELDLDTQLQNCEKRKVELNTWIKDNQDRIIKKKEKIKNCQHDVEILETELENLKKKRGK